MLILFRSNLDWPGHFNQNASDPDNSTWNTSLHTKILSLWEATQESSRTCIACVPCGGRWHGYCWAMQTSQQNGAIQRPFRSPTDWQSRKGFPEVLIWCFNFITRRKARVQAASGVCIIDRYSKQIAWKSRLVLARRLGICSNIFSFVPRDYESRFP